MNKNLIYYGIAVLLLTGILVPLYSAYKSLNNSSYLATRHHQVHREFQELRYQIKNAAIISPDLPGLGDPSNPIAFFMTDHSTIVAQVTHLNSILLDSINHRILDTLQPLVISELPWLLASNVPDSMLANQATGHLKSLLQIDTLIQHGLERSAWLTELRRTEIESHTNRIRLLSVLFVLVSVTVLAFTTNNLVRQQKMRRSKEAELATVLDRISDGVISVDNNWLYTYINDAALPTHSEGRGKILGRSIWEVHPQLKGTPFEEKFREGVVTGKTVELENYYEAMDTWFFVRAYPAKDGLTIFYRDVSESRKAAERLAESQKETADYKFALDTASIVAITDQKGLIRHANENFCRISGYTIGELIGQDHRLINSGLHSKDFIKNLWVTVANGNTWNGEIQNRAKDGSIYWVATTIVPFLNASGKPYQYIAIRSDITLRKLAEDKLKETQNQLLQLNKELEEKITHRTEELRKTNEELESFSYSVSHDLRAPLRGITGFAALLEEEYGPHLDREGKRITGVIRTSAARMGQLIDDLLAFSRTGKQSLHKTVIDTMAMVSELMADPAILMDRNPTWDLHALPDIFADRNTIRLVWTNLLGNAVKYSSGRNDAKIEIRGVHQDHRIVFSIRDNGVGFNPKYMHKLFKVFQRLHDSSEFEGTGVGLALVERILTRHQGAIWAESLPGQGACFYFSLPINNQKYES